jgi:hypothetical protein
MQERPTEVLTHHREGDRTQCTHYHRVAGIQATHPVEWTFAPQKSGTTFVRVTESGFIGTGDELTKYVADSTQGFTLMLAGLKAFLEHDVRLNLTADRYPAGVDEQEITKDWRGPTLEPVSPRLGPFRILESRCGMASRRTSN